MEKVALYRGKPLEEYTKEELIEIINCMYEHYESRLAGLRDGLRISALRKTW